MIIINICDLCTIERAVKNKVYPKGSTLIQLSATRGQIEYLESDSVVDAKFAVLMPNEEKINSKYFNITINHVFAEFLHKYKQNINLTVEDLKYLNIVVCNIAKQEEIVKHFELIEKRARHIQNKIDTLQDIKQTLLSEMFV